MWRNRTSLVIPALVVMGAVGIVIRFMPLQLPAILPVGQIEGLMPEIPVADFEFQANLDPASEILILQQTEPLLTPALPVSELESVFASELFAVPEAEQANVVLGEVGAAHIQAVIAAQHQLEEETTKAHAYGFCGSR